MNALTARRAVASLQGTNPSSSPLDGCLAPQSILRSRSATELATQIRSRAAKDQPTGGSDVVLVVSHQPTLFSYAGVYAQFFLADALAQLLSITERRARIVYLSLDTDDARDRRIRTAHLPLPTGHDGSLPISLPLPRGPAGVCQLGVEPPGREVLSAWTRRITGGMARCADTARTHANELRQASSLIGRRVTELTPNSSRSFADWAGAVLVEFLRPHLRSTVELRTMSDLAHRERATFKALLLKWTTIRDAADRGIEMLSGAGLRPVGSGLRTEDPAWMICRSCHRRTSLSADKSLTLLDGGAVSCPACGATQADSEDRPLIVPRVLIEDLLCQAALRPAAVLTYAGSAEHVTLGQWTAPAALGEDSRIFTWQPRHILGTALESAAITLTRDANYRGSAMMTLARILDGRDSLLHALAHPDFGQCVSAWSEHLGHRHLSEPVVCSEHADTILGLLRWMPR